MLQPGPHYAPARWRPVFQANNDLSDFLASIFHSVAIALVNVLTWLFRIRPPAMKRNSYPSPSSTCRVAAAWFGNKPRTMLKLAGFLCWLLLFLTTSALCQTNGFGDRVVELRGLTSVELAKPEIPSDAITDALPGNFGSTISRPLYLAYRYYSPSPWLSNQVRSVFSSVPGYVFSIETANDNPAGQLVTDINHPAHGLYCLSIRTAVPYDSWSAGTLQRFYVRLAHAHPPIVWRDHWWYYWRTPLYSFLVSLNSAKEVPPNSSPATGSGPLALDPIYKTLQYDISYSGLVANYSASHIHGPAGPGTNASVLFPLNNIPAGTRAGRLFGVTAPLTATQEGYLRSGLLYVNIHSTTFPGGEIRSQIGAAPNQIYSPWRPTWIPLVRWSRMGTNWLLTLTHPYTFPWDPAYRPRPIHLYGLRSYFTPIGSVQSPATMPGIASLNTGLVPPSGWTLYPKPIYKEWPYWPLYTRSYRFDPTPFGTYRHLPPVVQFAFWVNPDVTDPAIVADFPDDPQASYAGTVEIITLRALVSQQGDLTGDGFEDLSDQSAFKQEQGTTSQDTADSDGP